jgi:hypothetical protein
LYRIIRRRGIEASGLHKKRPARNSVSGAPHPAGQGERFAVLTANSLLYMLKFLKSQALFSKVNKARSRQPASIRERP